MTNDIVTRLRESHGEGCTCGAWNYSECGCSEATWAEMYITEAADEIERLRGALAKIEKAIVNEGPSPSYHRAVMKKHRKEWPTLHRAIDGALETLREARRIHQRRNKTTK